MPKRKQKGLVLLSYSDSEHEEEDQDDDEQHDYEDLKSNDESNEHFNDDNVGGGEQQSNKLVENEKKIYFEDIYGDRDLSILEFHQSLLGKADADDIQIPAATRTPCPNELQNQIENLYEKVKEGYDLIHAIQKRKSMRNPSIYEKMISYCEINEMATNYPKEIYDPEPFLQAQSFYEELSRQQKEEMEKHRVLSELNTSERQHYENDHKVIVDTILREVLILTLSSESESDYEKLKRLLQLSIALAKSEHCSINTPIVLLSELLDCCTLKECELLFSLIDDNIHIWKEEFFFKNVKNQLLRTCNDLLRRLSRNQNTVFCGRILIFLANFFPLFERSGLNLTSEFNQDNSTSYSLQEDEELDETVTSMDDDNDKSEKEADRIKVDMNFYKKFWQLQEYFRNPTISYQRNNFKNFQSYCNEVLSVFSGYKIDPNSCFYFQALGLDNNSNDDNKTIFFVKFLTNQKLLELQLSDSNFRRHILIQILIVFQYFTSNVKFRLLDNGSLNEEQLAWINNIRIKVHQLIEETPPNGKEVRKVIQHLLNREEFWNNWKNEGCSELKQIDEPEDVRQRTADYIASTYTVSQKRARLGEHVRNAINNNKILIGNAELNRLWNFCPDNLDACRSPKRIFTPSIEQFFQPLLKRPAEERQFYCG
ncbi:THO complex subunit 1-like protein [Euroglyphus maynei]|uniref:THO complex subunit 1-like protein n=1 Tax=Euroglyphus maynei TaxID=6958 RepID=A0A1Y3BRK8_EURMA|nr:THO complex subunit 1-like protein [Euroglyphus maynei]